MECTPGQWKIHKGEMNDCGAEFWITGNDDEGCVIAHVNSKIYDERIETEEAEANANLIVASPDLYQACKYALSVLESIPEEYAEQIADKLDESIDVAMLERAIDKAKGKKE